MKKKKTAQERFNEYVKLCKKNKKLVKKAYKILSWESEWDLESPEQLRSLDLKKIIHEHMGFDIIRTAMVLKNLKWVQAFPDEPRFSNVKEQYWTVFNIMLTLVMAIEDINQEKAITKITNHLTKEIDEGALKNKSKRKNGKPTSFLKNISQKLFGK